MRNVKIHRALGVLVVVLALVAAACGDDDTTGDTTATTAAPVTTATTPAATTEAPGTTAAPGTTEAPAGEVVYAAAQASITVDGDPSDWAAIPAVDMTLTPIKGEEVVEAELHDATVKVAYDADNVYVLFAVDDDFDWVEGDAHKSAAVGVAWAIDPDAGEAMGATEDDHETSLGMVDIWHWELDCAAGVESGGAFFDAGDGKDPGNDSGCNLDDEYAFSPEDREDDDEIGAENSLFGVYSHTAGVNGEAGTWYFEMGRPLQTADTTDAQFHAGDTGLLALAYWDPDQTPEGWEDDSHVQSTDLGWINVEFGDKVADAAGDADYVAPEASITVDGDPSDWAAIPAFDLALDPIKGEEDVVEPKVGSVKVAYDADNVYVLFAVDDDFDWVEGDAHKSGAIGVAWAIDPDAGVAMGGTEDDQEVSLGIVDIWHWELDCAAGVDSGGAFYEPGDGKDAGNDSGCNFDDEYSSTPEDREDDDEIGAENSLFGVYSHTAGVNGEAGTWYFEMGRPLQTADTTDAQFHAGDIGLLALAYWDADLGPDGWDDDEHVQSTTEHGWIKVLFGG